MKPLMQKAEAAKKPFTPPDLAPHIPPELKDDVDRITAAGMKLLYAPQMKEDVMAAIKSPEPPGIKLGQNVAGLMLILDQKAQGSMPVDAIFPAAMQLLVESANMLQAAGETVTDDDFRDAGLSLYATLFKKMGASDEEIMSVAQGGQAPPEAPEAPEGEMPEGPEQEMMA